MCGGGPPPGTSCDSTALTTPPVSRPWMRMTIGMPRIFTFLPPSLGTWIGFMWEMDWLCCQRFSLVSHCRAARSGEMDEVEAFESDLAAPFAEVRAAEIKGVAKFDQHVQRHKQAEDVFAPRIVDDILNSHESAAR